MKNFKKLSSNDLKLINIFILKEKKDFSYFTNLGWSKKNIENQLEKSNNFTIGYIKKNQILGILIGDLINNDNYLDLEIHILFVSKKYRRNKIGTSMLNYIISNKKSYKISKLYLEVAENNKQAIKFYEKNDFVFFNFRHNYYRYKNNIINAKCFSKII